MTAAAVPEGQVARDAKFWATYEAVQSQHARASTVDGYVVVSFVESTGDWCTLGRCPVGIVQWFPTREEGRRYMESLPDWSEPHILHVEDGARYV